jgi:glycosyltransferase involved in cell wall biosynthesis
MKIVGITRVRNEELIIRNTLDHVSKLVDEIYVYDDFSTDLTPEICENHWCVKKVIKGSNWDPTSDGRAKAEGSLRQIVYKECLKSNPDWVYYFDADEYADFSDIDLYDNSINSVFLRLFDFYITENDINKNYLERKYMGVEYRDIMMLFRPTEKLTFNDRQPVQYAKPSIYKGYVKHYGKAISVEEWEKTCDYYINHRGGSKRLDFTNKWKKRKGKAIHTKSDFNRPLITWEERKTSNELIKIG